MCPRPEHDTRDEIMSGDEGEDPVDDVLTEPGPNESQQVERDRRVDAAPYLGG